LPSVVGRVRCRGAAGCVVTVRAGAVTSARRLRPGTAVWCGEPLRRDGGGREDGAWPSADVVAAWRAGPRI